MHVTHKFIMKGACMQTSAQKYNKAPCTLQIFERLGEIVNRRTIAHSKFPQGAPMPSFLLQVQHLQCVIKAKSLSAEPTMGSWQDA
jgi:hypothetical protein